MLRNYLQYLCQQHGIRYVEQEESYTSKASFFDNDDIPTYGEEVDKMSFSGKRVKRGLYQIDELANDDDFLNDFNARSQLAFATKLIAIHNLSRGNEDHFKYYMMVSSTIEAENNTEDLISKLIINDFILTPSPAE